eukprot:TRINITY_DN3313_c0_g1_i1.p2 TRINITY_DN3313_c0_g1~~TRINITY_DN3313_c0_g1_i1.p2  ORF type:complete len:120 (+),score=18.27 TRINITY_DN3313_c0_g1_i1:172-531(+)
MIQLRGSQEFVHCPAMPTPKSAYNGAWVLRATYYQRKSTTKGVRLMSSSKSAVLSAMMPELRQFDSKEQATAAAAAFQAYLNNPSRKAEPPQHPAQDATTPCAQRPEILCPPSKRPRSE